MTTFTYHNVRIAGVCTVVPEPLQELKDFKGMPANELERFCDTTGIYRRHYGSQYHQTGADLCCVATERLLKERGVGKDEIGAMVFLTQTPDYVVPPTSCVIQHRLGLNNCDLVYDSNLGCSAFPFGLQMICAALSEKVRYGLVLVGDSISYAGGRGTRPDSNKNSEKTAQSMAEDDSKTKNKDDAESKVEESSFDKDSLLFGDAGCAVLVEYREDSEPIHIGLKTIGSGYRDLIGPFGMHRHPLGELMDTHGYSALKYDNAVFMDGENVFTFSVTKVPREMKVFMSEYQISNESVDFLAIHQANKLIVDSILKRLKMGAEKIDYSLNDYGNCRGVSCVLSLCHKYGDSDDKLAKRVEFLAFGIGLNIGIVDCMIEPDVCMPISTTCETYDDGLRLEDYKY